MKSSQGKSAKARAREAIAEEMRGKTYARALDEQACDGLTTAKLVQGLLVLFERQHREIARLEDRIRVLERSARHK